ncbi:MAG TPA: polyprenol monophosphomannose synthase [Patescibacteria group bacterium]|nr:polyprenol monophosphomannose synthase [Patescibacteria group bacterium]
MLNSLVIIPTHNEVNNLPVLVAELWALQMPGLSILIVDGDSSDGTGQLADELAQQRPDSLSVLHLSARGGLRRAYIAGFKWAIVHGACYIIQMDCDFSHSPKYIPVMLESAKQADLVIGSRYISGGKMDERMGILRYLRSWWANTIYARSILNLGVKDVTSGYRCWQAHALQHIDLDGIASNGYSFQIEMAYVAEKLGYKIAEVPIFFEERRIGQTKMRLSAKVEAAWRIWYLAWRYRELSPAADKSSKLHHSFTKK